MSKKEWLKRSLLAVMAIVVLFALTGCGNKKTNENKTDGSTEENSTSDLANLPEYKMDSTEDTQEFQDASSGAKFNYPTKWEVIEQDGQKLVRDSSLTGASVNVNSADLPDSMTFDTFIAVSIQGLKQQMTIEGDVSQEWINLNGKRAAKLDYAAKQTDATNVNIEQIVFKNDKKVYILTTAVLADNAEVAQPELQKIVKSFRLDP